MYCEEYVLRVLCVSRGSVLRILPVLPSISCFSTAGTYLPGVPYCSYCQYTLSSWAFSVLAIFWPPVLQYSPCSDYELFSSICYFLYYGISVKTIVSYPERQETFILREYMLYVLDLYSVGHKSIMSQPRPHATFHTYVHAASIGLIAASHLSRINIHFYQYTLFYIIEMIPHYFHKQQYTVCPKKSVCVFSTLMMSRCSCYRGF